MDTLLKKCKEAWSELNKLNREERINLLMNISKALALPENINKILEENKKDIVNAKNYGISQVMIDRLSLNYDKVIDLSNSVIDITKLDDYIGKVEEEYRASAGFKIKKIRVPFGVIAAVFESRPNVSVDIASLTLFTANACVLKGGKEAINTNRQLVSIMRDAISPFVNPDVITLIESTDRKDTDLLITKKEYIDLLIPRGSKRLIDYIVNNAKVPYIETGAGNCHLYVHSDANIDMAVKIAINAKISRPSVCNAIENIVVDKKVAKEFLIKLKKAFDGDNIYNKKIEIRGDEFVNNIIDSKLATEDDYYTEYNDYICAIKTVDNIDQAISFINLHSTKHSESIITENSVAKDRFLHEIDSACVYHNVSTRFTDGGCFGFGAEIGISTTKLHARGPMGLYAITTYKYVIEGEGEVR